MASPSSKSPIAGGALIALGTILGAAVGLFTAIGPTRGFLIGLGVGIAMSVAIWLTGRER